MIQGALDADGRIAAKNAVKIKAALHQVTDFKRVFEKYQETHPQPTDNPAQDRTRARSWVLLNVYLNDEALDATVKRAWAEAYVLGQAAASEWINKTREAQKADQSGIDWDNWQPGDKATALLLNPTGGFAKFLEQSGGASFFKKFDKETVENLGTALSNSIELGLDAEHAAVMIGKHVASASRALSIAITEQNRAMSYGSIQRYKEAQLEKMEWHTSDPCDKCAQNGGAVVVIGQDFPSGVAQPPAHPHCRCVLLPVIPGMEEEPAIPGAVVTPMPTGVAHTGSAPKPAPVMEIPQPTGRSSQHIPGNWSQLPASEIKQRQLDRLTALYPGSPRLVADFVERDPATKAMIENGKVLVNGPLELRLYRNGMEVPEENINTILAHLDRLQVTNPKSEQVILTIGEAKAGAYGWAVVGGEDIWIAPKTAKIDEPNVKDAGNFKMPALATTKQYLYTLTHEWGHHIDVRGQAAVTRRITAIKKRFPDAFRSGYSGESRYEFYAEMFAEYYLSGGKTDNELVQAMAKEFGWKA